MEGPEKSCVDGRGKEPSEEMDDVKQGGMKPGAVQPAEMEGQESTTRRAGPSYKKE